MDASDDLDLEGNESNTTTRSASQPVKKNIQLKLSKPATRGRAKGKKGTRGRKAASAPKNDEPPPPPPPVEEEKSKMEVDIMDEEVELVTIKSAIPVEPKHNDEKLNWNHKVNLIGEKVIDPFIYCCDKCTLPILIYGRMIPCKHVFCYDCAKKTSKNCPRCNEAVNRIEQSALGTVFVCMHGGSKHGSEGCRRTYLSHRDLQAHVMYRHGGGPGAGGSSGGHGQSQASGGGQLGARQQDSRSASSTSKSGLDFPSVLVQAMQQQQQPPPQQQMPPSQQPPPMIDTRNPPPALPGMMYQQQSHHLQQPPPQGLPPPVGMYQGPPPQVPRQGPPQSSAIESYHTIPVMSSRRDNLINVQMQDEQRGYQHRDTVTNYSQPPPGYTNPAQGFPSVSHSLPPHSGGPPPVYANPSQSVAVPFSASLPPPMQTGQLSRPPPNMTGPPPIVRPDLTQPPPLIPAAGHMTGPPRYPSPHPHYDEQVFSQTGGHSPRTTWTGPGGPPQQRGPPPGGPPPQRAPPPTVAPTSTAGMGLPPPGPYFQQ